LTASRSETRSVSDVIKSAYIVLDHRRAWWIAGLDETMLFVAVSLWSQKDVIATTRAISLRHGSAHGSPKLISFHRDMNDKNL
jgi:hypothetical protein